MPPTGPPPSAAAPLTVKNLRVLNTAAAASTSSRVAAVLDYVTKQAQVLPGPGQETRPSPQRKSTAAASDAAEHIQQGASGGAPSAVTSTKQLKEDRHTDTAAFMEPRSSRGLDTVQAQHAYGGEEGVAVGRVHATQSRDIAHPSNDDQDRQDLEQRLEQRKERRRDKAAIVREVLDPAPSGSMTIKAASKRKRQQHDRHESHSDMSRSSTSSSNDGHRGKAKRKQHVAKGRRQQRSSVQIAALEALDRPSSSKHEERLTLKPHIGVFNKGMTSSRTRMNASTAGTTTAKTIPPAKIVFDEIPFFERSRQSHSSEPGRTHAARSCPSPEDVDQSTSSQSDSATEETWDSNDATIESLKKRCQRRRQGVRCAGTARHRTRVELDFHDSTDSSDSPRLHRSKKHRKRADDSARQHRSKKHCKRVEQPRLDNSNKPKIRIDSDWEDFDSERHDMDPGSRPARRRQTVSFQLPDRDTDANDQAPYDPYRELRSSGPASAPGLSWVYKDDARVTVPSGFDAGTASRWREGYSPQRVGHDAAKNHQETRPLTSRSGRALGPSSSFPPFGAHSAIDHVRGSSRPTRVDSLNHVADRHQHRYLSALAHSHHDVRASTGRYKYAFRQAPEFEGDDTYQAFHDYGKARRQYEDHDTWQTYSPPGRENMHLPRRAYVGPSLRRASDFRSRIHDGDEDMQWRIATGLEYGTADELSPSSSPWMQSTLRPSATRSTSRQERKRRPSRSASELIGVDPARLETFWNPFEG